MFSNKTKILVTCSKGVAPFLSMELEQLDFPILEEMNLGVFTKGTFEDCYTLNFKLRTGLRVLYQLKEFEARTPNDLYDQLYQIPWQEIFPSTGYLSVTSFVLNDRIKNTQFANLKSKDAIVDRIAEKKGRRPDSGPDRTKSVVFLYWKDSEAAIFIDTSGEPLAKRGYRKIPATAPMQETLAAAVLFASGWDPDTPFVNPMCGSGTLGIEAALMATNKAPGLLRSNFGFMHCLNFDRRKYQEIRRKLRLAVKQSTASEIILSDNDGRVINAAGQNAQTAGVDRLLKISKCDFSKTRIPDGEGVVIMNPPYGMRMGEEEDLALLYADIGDFFKQDCSGYKGFIFSGNLDLLKKVGLKSAKRTIFYSSTIEARLVEYDLYTGNRKINHVE